ncbi:alpha/beta hydrolase [Subtercola boreus]|uniref:AB hydrolase-1 domain-containing protein n=1 Tax=Subtercola boreus TaxID=120213 RepID=A0A3E0WA99_9MICO|nr:alpha/beta hydrolase [Subtercola boreus]RFA20004.1 hypothetical protein B7R24_10485 [Subtercola boreus]RFA20133.1 hypothetical protein B7R23_10425 [Subtercola boreus]RFA26460.1 hypothetical protein B7R25_10550 [Subtercola boreus]
MTGTIFFLPGLGLGAEAAAPLAAALGDRFRVVGIDLPGQGEAPDAADGSVGALAGAALEAIEAESDGGPWLLVAHSMGGKVAALVISRVLGGQANVFGLAGAVLLAPSPPTPEPMDDGKRAQMLSWADDGPLSEADARAFVDQNVAAPLGDSDQRNAVGLVRRTSALSWRRWLSEGSREDVSATVGTIDLPVVVLAGEEDVDLGASAQPGLLGRVYPRARFVSLPDTVHLLPYERAREVAAAVVELWESTVSVSPAVPPHWGRVVASDRTPVEARALLARRAIADDVHYEPRALSAAQLTTLGALADRVVPQPEGRRIDLAARVDAELASGSGDGWRPAGLPDDASAYRLGLDALAAVWPAGEAEQNALVARIVDGESIEGAPWSDDLLRLWFEDARNDLVRNWLAHPASLARVGYDGFATSGPGAGPAGYVELAAGTRDPWEPDDLGALASGHDDPKTDTDPGALTGRENTA